MTQWNLIKAPQPGRHQDVVILSVWLSGATWPLVPLLSEPLLTKQLLLLSLCVAVVILSWPFILVLITISNFFLSEK